MRLRVPSPLRVAPAVLLALAAGALDCASLADIPRGTCGNAVVDPGEDCDGFPRGPGTACGAPGAPAACRLTCSFDGRTTCPTGWGCGADGVCRAPTGAFARRPDPIVAGAWRVTIGDFDGDHRQDVLTRGQVDARGFSKLRAHYFDRTMALADTGVLAKKVGSPVARDLDGDGRADVLFTLAAVDSSLSGLSAGAVDVMLGQADRTFSPIAYPTFVFPHTTAMMYPILGFPGSPARVLVFSGGPMGTVLAHPDTTSGMIGVMAPMPKGPDALAGAAVPANVIESTPCDELVWAFRGDVAANVLSTCKRDLTGWGWNDGASPIAIALPSGVTVDAGVRVADIDGDHHLDVLIGAAGTSYVALGDGMGGFGAPAPLVLPVIHARGATATPTAIPFPLAVADVSGDGKVDFVTPQSVIASIKSDPNGAYGIPAFKAPGTWTSAVAVDVNGDGLRDIVAGTSADPDLDLFLGTGTFVLDPFTVPTFGTTLALTSGDVDGDLIEDLVVALGAPGADDQLAIAFGKPGAVPDAPVVVGSFGRIGEIATVNANAKVDSIGVISYPTNAAEPEVRIALLAGTGDRLPLAPFALTVPSGTPGVPFDVVAGKFAKDANVDFVALGGDQPQTPNAPFTAFRLWTAAATGPARFDTATPGDPLDATLHPVGASPTSQRAATLMASGDLDGDGVDEVVAVMPHRRDDACALVVAKPKSAATGASSSFGDLVELPLAFGTDGELALADVDGDGALDVVLLAGRDATRQLAVYWNDHGAFSAARATSIAPGESPTDFGLVHVGGARPAIAYVTRTKLVVATISDRTTVTPTTIDGALGYATGVAGGDLDGDGVDDLAVADTPSLVVYRGKPVLE